MYISMPDFFCTSVCYVNKNKLGIKKLVNLNKNNTMKRNRNQKRQGVLVGVSFPDKGYRWIRDNEAMKSYATDKDVRLLVEFEEYDQTQQEKQVEDLISKGINVLIVAPVD